MTDSTTTERPVKGKPVQPDNRMPVFLTGDAVADAETLAAAFAKSGALLVINGSCMAIAPGGELRPAGRAALIEVLHRYIVGRRVVRTGPDQYRLEHFEVEPSEQTWRNINAGRDLRNGNPLPGGSLDDRVPRVSI